MATHLMKMMATYLMKLCLIEYVLINLLNDVSTESREGNEERNSICARSMMKRVCLYVYADFPRGSHVCMRETTYQVAYGQKALKKCKTRGIHHGIDPFYSVMIHLIDPVQEYHRK